MFNLSKRIQIVTIYAKNKKLFSFNWLSSVKTKRAKVLDIFLPICLYLNIFILLVTFWLENTFGNLTYDKIIFHIKVPIGGANLAFVKSFILDVVGPSIYLFALSFLVFYSNRFFNFQTYLKVRLKKQGKNFHHKLFPFALIGRSRSLIIAMMAISIGLYSHGALNLGGVYKSQFETTMIYEDHYIDPDEVAFQFPEKPRNLILIFAESMETTFISEVLGGYGVEDYIPELTELARNNISFSDSEKIGGAYQVYGTGWTIAAMVTHTAGIPLNLPINGNMMHRFSSFLPGAVTLGDILKKQGYQQTFLIGSDKHFAGRAQYFTQHGYDSIKDYYHYIENGSLPNDYRVSWGFEDKKLFKFAQEEVLELSKKNKPFNLTILTLDTHHPDGYLDASCPKLYDKQFANVLRCSSREIRSFVDWLRQQGFYNDTTIVILGDHLSMDVTFFEDIPATYPRRIFNAFINAPSKPVQEKNRIYTTMDYFPTILDAIGVKIDKPGLGLGRSLWRDVKTLPEKLGISQFHNEISKKSKVYDSMLYGDY